MADRIGFFAACLAVVIIVFGFAPATRAAILWNPKAAAAYLDQRERWWMTWPGSARDHHTFCVSCHTVLPYALARPALRAALGESSVSPEERTLLDSVTTRVRRWGDVQPFYTESSGNHKSAESRGTEAVLNALILANYDTRTGILSDDTRSAFDNMWAIQRTTGEAEGAWWWLQFDNEPWEAHDSQYYGAAIAGVAIGTAPERYRSTTKIQKHVKSLAEYLNREYKNQSLINQATLLWASAKWPGLLAAEPEGLNHREYFAGATTRWWLASCSAFLDLARLELDLAGQDVGTI